MMIQILYNTNESIIEFLDPLNQTPKYGIKNIYSLNNASS